MPNVRKKAGGWRMLESVQCTLTAITLFAAALLVHNKVNGPFMWHPYFMCGILVAATSILQSLARAHFNKEPLGLAAQHDVTASLGQTLSISFVLFSYFVAINGELISRGFLFSYSALLFVTLILSRRWTAKFLCPFILESQHSCGTIVIGGTPEKADQLAAWIESKSSIGLRAIGWVSTSTVGDEAIPQAPTLPVLGCVSQLEAILEKTQASVVIVADFIHTEVDLSWLRSMCDRHEAELAFNMDFGDSIPFAMSTFQENGLNLLALQNKAMVNEYQRVIKRAFDVAISLPVVITVLPLLAILFRCVHKLQAPGPLMVKQKRLGLHGRRFTIYKFRTTYCEKRGNVTFANLLLIPWGSWLRRLRLDVFPQFLNVLHGSMSLVGPRPQICEAEGELAGLSAPFHGRNFIKPGITGLVQLSSLRITPQNTDEVIDRTKTDLYYVESWSLKMDATILAKTFRRFAMNKHPKARTRP